MSVAAFLAELRSLDIEVWPDGEQLRCNAPAGSLNPALRNTLRERKSEIVKFLRSAEAAARQPHAIVPIQPRGARTPVFAVGGHNGDVFCYRALAQCLGEDQPFFGLRPPGLDGEAEPLSSIPDLAAHFSSAIQSVHSSGACIIAGYCAGGAIAFEVAQHLVRQGEQVQFVALFAGRYPTWFGRLGQFRHRFAHYTDRLHVHTRALATGSLSHASRYLREMVSHVTTSPHAVPTATPDPAQALIAKVQQATMKAICSYAPPYFDGRLILFLPSAKARRPADGLLQWRDRAQYVEERVGPDGCEGDTMLLERHAPAFAGLFRYCCDHRQAV